MGHEQHDDDCADGRSNSTCQGILRENHVFE